MDRKIYELHAELCQIFTSPKRLEILDLLRQGERSVGELAALAEIPQANLSQHLAVLRQKKIVNTRREGTNVFYSMANPKIIKACDLMREVLLEQLAAEEKLLQEIKGG